MNIDEYIRFDDINKQFTIPDVYKRQGHDLHADASILTFLSGMFFHFKVQCK